jgi:GTP-binding protein Era
LLNRLVGAKLAAVTAKPQTTRNRIVGILTRPEAQILFVDTPGLHAAKAPLNTRMVAVARQALGDTDLRVLVIDAARGVTADDRRIAQDPALAGAMLVVVSKIDLVTRDALLGICTAAARLRPDTEVVPVSGATGDNVPRLLEVIVGMVPVGPAMYPSDQLSEQSERFLAAEIIREQVIAQTRDELPYATAVVVDAFQEEPDRRLVVIHATVLVERDSQKGIVIGEQGRRIREIGQAARVQLEETFDCRMFLDLRAKVARDWSKDPRMLRDLGL